MTVRDAALKPDRAIRALVFDFDGLIIDTESTELHAWEEVYRLHGCRLEPEVWADCVGRPPGSFDPASHLANLATVPIDAESLSVEVRSKARALAHEQPLLPGVLRWLDDARELGLMVGIVSSSSHHWVESHLERLAIRDRFARIVCREDTTAHKPDPEPYRVMASLLGLRPDQIIVLEDSPHGVAAASAAGAWCVAVPGPVTRQLAFGPSIRTITSLDELNVREVLDRIDRNRPC